MLSSKMVVVLNLITLLLFAVLVGMELLEAQSYFGSIGPLF